MSIRRLFLFVLVVVAFLIATGIPISPNISTDFVISGTVYDNNGVGLVGVELVGFPEEVFTIAGGNYSTLVPLEWSGTVTPTPFGYTFLPISRDYTNVTSALDNQNYTAYEAPDIIVGRNVNMVAGLTLPDGDPYLQRQNEPSIAVSTRNPLHLLAGANDYRTVDIPTTEGPIPGQIASGDGWLGVFKSFNGGESWKSTLLPGFPQDLSQEGLESPLYTYDTACDPTVRAGPNGLFYYSGIAFDRGPNGLGILFVARFMDNNFTTLNDPDPIKYLDATKIDEGTAGQFADKPWIAVDKPRDGNLPVLIDPPNADVQEVDGHNVYIVYSVFLGETPQGDHSKILFARSTDCGTTWEVPHKISEGQHRNQGTTMAVSPKDGYIYIAWRRFVSPSQPDAIMMCKSIDFGLTFNKAVEVATILPFDQFVEFDQVEGKYIEKFRTYAFPTLAVDHDELVYVAWADRGYAQNGDGRIVIKTSADGIEWSGDPMPIDNHGGCGHQFMPSIAYAAGKLMSTWYDSRDSLANTLTYCGSEMFDPNPSEKRHTIDVRIAQAQPGLYPQFEDSKQVSKYLHSVEIDYSQNPPVSIIKQLEYNPPNYPLFVGGTLPFIGDYIDIAPAPAFLFDPEAGSWHFNTGYTPNEQTQEWSPDTFHVTWTDNRDVRIPPAPDYDWTSYNPPDVPTSGTPCLDGTKTGMRNQNIYTSAITRGIIVGAPVNTKQLIAPPPQTVQGNTESYQQKITFLVFVKNLTEIDKYFRLTIDPDNGMTASFWEEWPLVDVECPFINCGDWEVDLLIEPHSTNTLTVFVEPYPTNPYATFRVNVKEIEYDPIDEEWEVIDTGFQSYITLNPDPVNTQIVPPPEEGELHTPNVLIESPTIFDLTNPDVLSDSLVYIPNLDYILNYTNPDLATPAYRTPAYRTGSIVNPAYRTSLIGDFSDGKVTDIQWRITNYNDTASAYSFLPVGEIPVHPNPDEDVAYQLLIYKVNSTPASPEECVLIEEEHHELVYSTPAYRTPAYRTPAYRTPAYRTPAYRTNTLSLAPGESALCTIRLISSTSNPFDAEEYAKTVAVEAVPQAANPDGTIDFATSLYIISRDPIENPLEAWVNDYYETQLEAYGGTPDEIDPDDDTWKYIKWRLRDGESLPSGLDLDDYGRIYGTPQYDPSGSYPKEYFVVVELEDKSTPPQIARREFKITINCELHTITSSAGPGGSITPSNQIVPHGLDSEEFKINPLDCFHVVDVIVDENTSDPLGPVTTHTFTDVRADHTIHAIFDIDTFIITASAGVGGSITPVGEQTVNCDASIEFTISVDEGYMLEDVVLDKLTSPVHLDPVMTYTFELVRADHTIEAIFKKLEKWVKRYNNEPFNGNDEAKDIAVNLLSNNVYVTGYSLTRNKGEDIYTISYNSDGVKGLSGRYDGPAHKGDFGNAIAVDSSGNVSVTGQSFRGMKEEHSDYCTIQYNSSEELVWDVRYDARRNGHDVATAIAMDLDGNVYTTGRSEYSFSKKKGVLHYDFYTVKYNANGTIAWYDRYDNTGVENAWDGAVALAVDLSSGDVYVTGKSEGSGTGFDIVTIKYLLNGDLDTSWGDSGVVRYDNNGLANTNDEAAAIALDSSGNVYVTGKSEGNGTGFDIVTIKYNTDRDDPLWVARYTNDGGNGNDEATAIAVDSAGNVYVTGYSWNGVNNDYITIMYDSSGNELWAERYDNNGADEATDIGIDTAGNVYVTGRSQGSGTGFDYYTIKYDNLGNMVWRVRYDNTYGDDEARALVVDSLGNVYVTGSSKGDGTGFDYATIKYEQQPN